MSKAQKKVARKQWTSANIDEHGICRFKCSVCAVKISGRLNTSESLQTAVLRLSLAHLNNCRKWIKKDLHKEPST